MGIAQFWPPRSAGLFIHGTRQRSVRFHPARLSLLYSTAIDRDGMRASSCTRSARTTPQPQPSMLNLQSGTFHVPSRDVRALTALGMSARAVRGTSRRLSMFERFGGQESMWPPFGCMAAYCACDCKGGRSLGHDDALRSQSAWPVDIDFV